MQAHQFSDPVTQHRAYGRGPAPRMIGVSTADRVADVVYQTSQLKAEIIGMGATEHMGALQAVSKQVDRITLRRRGIEHAVEAGEKHSERVDIHGQGA